jgi:cytidylate kinase
MEVNQQAISAMRAVTISREYGSGGGEIATRLAGRLGWQLIDHAIIEQTARELGIHETTVARYDDEYVESTLSRILHRLRNFTLAPVSTGVGGLAPFSPGISGIGTTPPLDVPLAAPRPTPVDAQAYHLIIQDVVRAAARSGHVVIVGRGGQFLLAGQRDVLHIRVVAPLEQRVHYVAQREGLDMEAARARVQEKDRARERNMQNQFHRKPDDPHLYDLVINTGVLELDRAVDLIYLALEGKARLLGIPVEQLGPASGLAPYAGKPADFRVPG